MSLGTSAGFCFCFVSAAAARRNDVDVIANPTTGCETHSLANGEGGCFTYFAWRQFLLLLPCRSGEEIWENLSTPDGTSPKSLAFIAQG